MTKFKGSGGRPRTPAKGGEREPASKKIKEKAVEGYFDVVHGHNVFIKTIPQAPNPLKSNKALITQLVRGWRQPLGLPYFPRTKKKR